jgi:hypothetical protein
MLVCGALVTDLDRALLDLPAGALRHPAEHLLCVGPEGYASLPVPACHPTLPAQGGPAELIADQEERDYRYSQSDHCYQRRFHRVLQELHLSPLF